MAHAHTYTHARTDIYTHRHRLTNRPLKLCVISQQLSSSLGNLYQVGKSNLKIQIKRTFLYVLNLTIKCVLYYVFARLCFRNFLFLVTNFAPRSSLGLKFRVKFFFLWEGQVLLPLGKFHLKFAVWLIKHLPSGGWDQGSKQMLVHGFPSSLPFHKGCQIHMFISLLVSQNALSNQSLM